MHPSLGLESKTVRVVPYDAAWPALFADETRRLREALGPLPIALEHTGSTAVPGLAAKPILDILGGYPAGASVEAYIDAFVGAGYVHRGEQGIPGRQFFRRGDPRSYHLHLTTQGSAFWTEQLTFRDALRRDQELRDAYADLKLELARKNPMDRETYSVGKTDFVHEALRRVRQA